jgi:hypothetical protein
MYSVGMAGGAGTRGRARLALVPLLIAVTIGLAACLPPPPPPPPPDPPAVTSYCASKTPASPGDYQQAFDGLRTAGAEWAASDGSIPVALPDGRVLWMFGDTIVGRVQADASIADGWKMIRNSFVVQNGACLMPMMGGARGSRTESIANPAPNEWFWPTAGVVENNGTQLRVFMLRLTFTSDPEPFNFTVIGVEVATYALPDLTLLSITNLPLAAPDAPPYGQTVLVGNDGYLYLYGSQAVSCGCMLFDPREQEVARAPLGSETTPAAWEFAVVDPDTAVVTWSNKATNATPMLFGPSGFDPATATINDAPRAPLEVTPYRNGYLATAKTIDGFSDDVSTWLAPTPTGPWSYVNKAVRGLPGDPTHTFSYGGRIVTNLPGSPVLIWSQNRMPLSDVIANNALYKAHFASPAPAALP